MAPPSPATRDQVDAYRFGLRGLEAALVRGDPVPVHEQVRAQRRAVAAGVVLGVLGLVVALVVAVAVPRPAWQRQDLLVGARPSGALYVVARDPDRLVPVANAVSGRLVLAALRSAPVLTEPVLVDDGVLAGAPRTPAAAVAGAVGVDPRARAAPHIGRCATRSRPRERWSARPCSPIGCPDDDVGSALIAVPGGDTWLVTGGHRHRVDLDDGPSRTALGLTGRVPGPRRPVWSPPCPRAPRW